MANSGQFVVSITLDNLSQLTKLQEVIESVQGTAKKPIIQQIDIQTDKVDKKLKQKLKEWDELAKKGLSLSTGGGVSGGRVGSIEVKLSSKELERKLDALTKALPTSKFGRGANSTDVLNVRVVNAIKIDSSKFESAVKSLGLTIDKLSTSLMAFTTNPELRSFIQFYRQSTTGGPGMRRAASPTEQNYQTMARSLSSGLLDENEFNHTVIRAFRDQVQKGLSTLPKAIQEAIVQNVRGRGYPISDTGRLNFTGMNPQAAITSANELANLVIQAANSKVTILRNNRDAKGPGPTPDQEGSKTVTRLKQLTGQLSDKMENLPTIMENRIQQIVANLRAQIETVTGTPQNFKFDDFKAITTTLERLQNIKLTNLQNTFGDILKKVQDTALALAEIEKVLGPGLTATMLGGSGAPSGAAGTRFTGPREEAYERKVGLPTAAAANAAEIRLATDAELRARRSESSEEEIRRSLRRRAILTQMAARTRAGRVIEDAQTSAIAEDVRRSAEGQALGNRSFSSSGDLYRAIDRQFKQQGSGASSVGRTIRFIDAYARTAQGSPATGYNGPALNPLNERSFFRELDLGLNSMDRALRSIGKFETEYQESESRGLPSSQKLVGLRQSAVAATASQQRIIELLGAAQSTGIPGSEVFAQLRNQYIGVSREATRQRRLISPALLSEMKATMESTRDAKGNIVGIPDNIRANYRSLAEKQFSFAAGSGITKESLAAITSQEEKLRTAIINTSRAFSEQYKEMNSSKTLLGDLANKFRSLFLYATAGSFVYGAFQGIQNLTGSLVQLEAQVRRVQGILGVSSAASARNITGSIIDVSKQYGVDTGTVAQTYQMFAQSGLTQGQALQETKSTIAAQIGGGLDADTAQKVAVAVRNLTGGSVTSEDIFGRIARIEASTPVSGQEIASGIQRAGSLFSQLQPQHLGSIDSFDALIGAMTRIVEVTRLSGEQSATSLKFIVSRITTPQVANALQNNFGINLADETGKTLRPITDILQDISKKYIQLGPNSVAGAQLLQTLAGNRQLNQAQALLSNFNRAMQLAAESSMAFGDVQRRVNLQMDTVQQQFGKFKASLVGFLDSLFNSTGGFGLTKGILSGGAALLDKGAESPVLSPLALGLGAVSTALLAKKGAGYLASVRGNMLVRSAVAQGIENTAGASALGGAEAALAGGTTTALESSAIFAGLGGFQRILTFIGSSFSFASVFAILGGIGAFAAAINKIVQEQHKYEQYLSIKAPTQGDIDTSDVGKRYLGIASQFNLNARDLNNVVARASATAENATIESLKGKVPPEILAHLFDTSTGARTYDPRLFKTYNSAFVQALSSDSRLLGFGSLSNKEDIAAQLQRTNVQYENAGSTLLQATLQESGKELEEQLRKDVDKNSDILSKAVPFLTLEHGGGKVFDEVRAENYVNTVTGLGPNANLDFKSIPVVDELGRHMDALAFIMSKVKDGTTTLGAALDDLANTQLQPGTKALKQFNENVYEEIKNAYKVTSSGTISGGKGGDTPGSAFFASFFAAYEKGLQRFISEHTGKAAQLAARDLAALQEEANRGQSKALFEKLRGSLRSTTVTDRLIELLGSSATRTQQLGTIGAYANVTGYGVNNVQERLTNAKTLFEGVAGIKGQVMTDLLKNENSIMNLQLTNDNLLPNTETVGDDETTAANSRLVNSFLSKIKDTSQYKDLVAKGKALRSIIKNYASEAGGLDKLPADQREFLNTALQQPDARLALSVGQIQAITARNYGAVGRESLQQSLEEINRQQSHAVQAQRLGGGFALSQVYTGSAINQASATGIPFAALGLQLGEVNSAYQYNKSLANTDYYSAVGAAAAGARNRGESIFSSVQYQEEVAKANSDYFVKVQQLDDTRMHDLQQLLMQQQDGLFAKLQDALHSAVREAGGGIGQNLSSYDALTADDTRALVPARRLKLNVLAGRLISPLASTVNNRYAAGLQDALTAPDGPLFPILSKIVGKPAEIEFASQEADLIEAAHVRGITEGFAQVYGGSSSGLSPISLRSGLRGVGGGTGSIGAIAGVGAALGATALMHGVSHGASLLDYTGGGFGGTGSIGLRIPSLASRFGRAIGGGSSLTDVVIGDKNSGPFASSPGFLSRLFKQDNRKLTGGQQLSALAGGLTGSYGGAALGEYLGKGRYSYAQEGSGIGAGLGGTFLTTSLGLFGGPLVGGLLGGLLGGLFGKRQPPITPPLGILERIEKNTRDAVTAIDNQTRNLLNLDSRLLNVPAGFAVSSYRPLAVGSGSNASQTNNFTFNIQSADPVGVRREVEKVLSTQIRQQGVFSSTKY